MYSNSIKSVTLLFLLVGSFSSLFADFYVIPVVKKVPNVIHVAASGGDFTSPIDAMNSITNASAENPYLIILDSGVYELSGSQLIIKSFVDIVGQGADTTTIRGEVSYLYSHFFYESAFVIAQNHTKIKSLKLENYSTGRYSNTLFCTDANVTLENLQIDKRGDNGLTEAHGIVIKNSSVYVKNLNLNIYDATKATYGIYLDNSTLFADNINIEDTSASEKSKGLYLFNDSYVDFQNGSINILVNNLENYGAMISSDSEITISNTEIIINGSEIEDISVKNHGVQTILNAVAMLNNVSITTTGYQAITVRNAGNSQMSVINSSLNGDKFAYAESESYISILNSIVIGNHLGYTRCMKCENGSAEILDIYCQPVEP